MKKTFIFGLFALAALATPVAASAQAPLQAKPIFPFFSSEKAEKSAAPAPVQPATTEVTESALDLEALKSQPLSVRRKMVATELDAIQGRLSVLSDKTKATAALLSKNSIDTGAAQIELAKATLSLAQARLIIDTLLLAVQDPKNDSVTTLMIGTATFKDTVVTAEDTLRTARESIISALSLLKIAVSAGTASAN